MKKRVYKIEKMDHFGRGIIKEKGKLIFIDNALLGDEVTISIEKEKRNYSIGTVEKITKKSPFRKKIFCSNCLLCGGCNIGNLIYNQQLKFKYEKVKNIIERYLKEEIKINPIVYSKDIGYRNKITLHVNGKKIGLYKKNSNDIIEINRCDLVNCEINNIIKRIINFVKDKDCNLDEIVIKSSNLKENMIVFKGVINEEEVLKEFKDISSIFINDKCLKDKYIKERLGEYEFVLSKNSFFQVNKYNTINLYNKVLNYVKEKTPKKVLDLYCGTGTIGIFVSKYAKEIIGIEEVEDAIDSAKENKIINNVNNINFICGRVEDYIDNFNDIDLIIVDPPRNGMSKKTIQAMLKIKPNDIIYVSCDVMTLVRDLNDLKKYYDIDEITPVDMFPNTYHVECVSLLHRKNLKNK